MHKYIYIYRTLNRIEQLPELTASAIDPKIDTICIQEHRYINSEDIKYHNTGNGWMLATASAWKNSVNALSYRNCVITPGWRLMRIWYSMCFHTLYDENLKIYIYFCACV